MNWYRIDLHLHTPGSDDYLEPDTSYLDILRRAEICGLDIIAFTDHNTVKGIGELRKEIENLNLLEELNRIRPDEKRELEEYRRLSDKLLLLPGFELTATFGFHILGIFPPETTTRELEHILLNLRVPPELLDKGSTNVGATVDVLTAYRIINEAGGLAIAAHANSSHGVAMQGFDFGGQTKIAAGERPPISSTAPSRSTLAGCTAFRARMPTGFTATLITKTGLAWEIESPKYNCPIPALKPWQNCFSATTFPEQGPSFQNKIPSTTFRLRASRARTLSNRFTPPSPGPAGIYITSFVISAPLPIPTVAPFMLAPPIILRAKSPAFLIMRKQPVSFALRLNEKLPRPSIFKSTGSIARANKFYKYPCRWGPTRLM
jgi:PHP family Zn ribbon phosphoesterase